MNMISLAEQARIVAALTEGVSIRGASRLTGHNKKTVNRLALNVGFGCMKMHDSLMVGLNCQRIEVDEIHSFVQNKKSQDRKQGQQYTFIALCGTSRAIVSYHTGKRTGGTTETFVRDLRGRIVGEPEISSDCFGPYLDAIREVCGDSIKYGRISKSYGIMASSDIVGRQDIISTQRVERQNLTLRQSSKRFARRSWGFSKKFENHCAAVGLYVFHYNFCRVNGALKITPAMELGVSNHVWTIEHLVSAALHGVIELDGGPRDQAPQTITCSRSLPAKRVSEIETPLRIEGATMARIRTIKPEFPLSETTGKLSRDARLLFVQLWTVVDDEGRTRAASRMLASLLYPYDDDARDLIDGWLAELEQQGCIVRYEVDGSVYLEICNWLKHQKIDHPSKSRFPNPREGSRRLAPDLGPRTMDRDLGPKKEPALRASAPKKVCRETFSSDWPPDFREKFWEAYPRKTERLAAMKALEKVHKTAKVPWEKLIEAVRRYAATADPAFTKHPTTWLNKGCWDDQPGGSNGAGISNKTRQSGGSDFFAGLAAVAANIDGDRPASRPEAEEVPVGRVNIDL